MEPSGKTNAADTVEDDTITSLDDEVITKVRVLSYPRSSKYVSVWERERGRGEGERGRGEGERGRGVREGR